MSSTRAVLPHLKTREVVRLVGIRPYQVRFLLEHNRLDPPPAKDVSGHLIWMPEDVARLQEALAAQDRRRGRGHRGGGA